MTPTKGVFAWEPAPTLFGVCVCILAVLFLDLASELGGGTGPSESSVLRAEEGKEGECERLENS